MKRERIWEDFPFPEADLRMAARVADQALTEALPQPEDCTYRFSREFRRKMDRLIRRTDRSGWVTGLRRVACFFLALLLSGTAWLTVDAQAREKVFGWLSESFGGAQHYFFEGAQTGKRTEVRYILPEVPAGYTEWMEPEEENGWSILYANDMGQILDFGYHSQQVDGVSPHLFFTVSGMEQKQGFVHELPADIYLDKTGKTANGIVWVDQETDTLLYISAYLEETELIRLAESVLREEK